MIDSYGKLGIVCLFAILAPTAACFGQASFADEAGSIAAPSAAGEMEAGDTGAVNKSAEVAAEFDGVPKATSGGVVEVLMFYLFGGTMLFSALGVCLSKSVVRMATFLFGTLGAVAVLYFLLGANYLGVIQLIVYAGGTLILLVFGVMLTSKSPWVRFECPRHEMVLAGAVSVLLFAGLATALVRTEWPAEAKTGGGGRIADFGKELLTTYLVPFEVASVMLLVVMIAAAYLARQEDEGA